GPDGSILASPDLVRWGEFDAGVTANLHAVVHGQGLFVAVGDSGVILTSFDGQKWETPVWQFNETPTLNNLYAVAAGDMGFLAGGETEALVGSVDGFEWKSLDVFMPSGIRHDFTYAFDFGQKMVAGGPGLIASVQFTANGESGGGRVVSEYLADAVNDNGAIVGVGKGEALLTDSGPFIQPDALHLNGIAASLDLAVAVGRFGSILISSNALDWAPIESGVTDDLNSAAYASGMFVVVGNASTILSSTNGLDWRAQQIHPIGNLSQVTFGGGWFVASAGSNPVAISADGLDWTVIAVTNWNSISDVSYGNGLFIGGGSSPVVISTDPHTWTRSIPGVLNGHFETVGFGNGMFVLFTGSY
ncbi:MAG TPA: hypothetical protein VL793_01200, partial [Patescibacteria group bacterium]|nr:hypothetical protein [Patescibacteria group bacterium]